MTEFVHQTVMLNEAVDGLNPRNGLVYVDATAGGGGHSAEIVKRILPDGKLFVFDVDPDAIAAVSERLAPWRENVIIIKASYSRIPEILSSLNIGKISGGILFDLGTSYHQLMKQEKGFSFSKEATLDMRFDPESSKTAYDIVNTYSEDELFRVFKEYGEERFSGRIARKIVEVRKNKPLETTIELANLVKSCVSFSKSKIHPATRIFQALRIEVNDELKLIESTLKDVIPLLETDARIAVISFHSLEDRLVKNTFKYYSLNCRCLPHEPVCKCKPGELEIITKKPITASLEEVKRNPPSRSAKLRIARKKIINGVD